MAHKREIFYAEDDCPRRAAFLARLMAKRLGEPDYEQVMPVEPEPVTTHSAILGQQDTYQRLQCPHCSIMFIPHHTTQTYCSKKCTVRAKWERVKKAAPVTMLECLHCGKPRPHGYMRFCSVKCQEERKRDMARNCKRRFKERNAKAS